jgi:hypothetical protein
MDMREAAAQEAEQWGPTGAQIAEKIRAMPYPPPEPIETAPEDESVILVTRFGWVGEAYMLKDEDTGEQIWFWISGPQVAETDTKIGWYPLPHYTSAEYENT